MFIITYETINQSDPTVSITVGNGANHVFGLLISQSYMSYVIMCDGFGEIVRCWNRPSDDDDLLEGIDDAQDNAWVTYEG